MTSWPWSWTLTYFSKKINISHNFWMARDRTFIFHKCIPYDKPFYLLPKCLTLTLNFDLHFKNFNIGHNFWMVMNRLFIFHMHNPYDKPLPLTCGIRGHSCFTNTSCLVYVITLHCLILSIAGILIGALKQRVLD